jgi:hypothetical protein
VAVCGVDFWGWRGFGEEAGLKNPLTGRNEAKNQKARHPSDVQHTVTGFMEMPWNLKIFFSFSL